MLWLRVIIHLFIDLFLQEMVDWFNAIRAARFHYLQVAFPGASDDEVRMRPFKHEPHGH